MFTCESTMVFWRSQKQTLIVTSYNHAEVIALHETSRECVWLRSVIQYIQATCRLPVNKDQTVLFEDNAACVAQIKEEYIKSDQSKHIPSKLFSFSQELEKNKEINIQYIRSSDNAVDLFTKAFPTTTFRKLICDIRMRHL